MFTTIGWTASVDQAALAAIAALSDPHVRVSGNDVIVPEGLNYLVGAYGAGVNLTRNQLASPSLRSLVLYELSPLDRGVIIPASPARFIDLSDGPLLLAENEALNSLTAEDGAGATRMLTLAWLADGPQMPYTGYSTTVRVTATTTLTAFAWTNAALTFDQSLPAGTYRIVGARFNSTGMIAARFVFPGSPWRPGVLGSAAVNDLPSNPFRRGLFGQLGDFKHNTPPTVDFLSGSADTSETGELDLVKIA